MKYLALICLFLCTACTPTSQIVPESLQSNTSSGIVMSGTLIEETETKQPEAVSKPAPNPVSLAAMKQRTPDGSDFTVGRILEQNSVYIRYAITYKSGELTISGIMNVPKGEGSFPLVVTNHGYIDPAVYTSGRGLRREQDYFARKGYVVIHPDYRNHAGSTKDTRDEIIVRLGYIEDVVNLLDSVKKAGLPYVDVEKTYMIGHSMGGGVTLGVITMHPELVDAAVLYAPVIGDMRDSFRRWMSERATAERLLAVYGEPDFENPFWDGINSEEYFSEITAPVKIFHGTNDADVPFGWSEETRTELEEAGKEVELVLYQGEGHEFGPKWNDFMEQSRAFFER